MKKLMTIVFAFSMLSSGVLFADGHTTGSTACDTQGVSQSRDTTTPEAKTGVLENGVCYYTKANKPTVRLIDPSGDKC